MRTLAMIFGLLVLFTWQAMKPEQVQKVYVPYTPPAPAEKTYTPPPVQQPQLYTPPAAPKKNNYATSTTTAPYQKGYNIDPVYRIVRNGDEYLRDPSNDQSGYWAYTCKKYGITYYEPKRRN